MDELYFYIDESLTYIMRNKYFLPKKELENLDKVLTILFTKIMNEKIKRTKTPKKRGKR